MHAFRAYGLRRAAAVIGAAALLLAPAASDPKGGRAGKWGRAAREGRGVGDGGAGGGARAGKGRGALLFVSRGGGRLGIVSQPEAAADPNVGIVGAFPESTHPPIVYPV